MIRGQLIAPGQLTDSGATLSDACDCSHEFFVAPGQLREGGYPLYNNG